MANRQYAIEWLELAKHNLEAVRILFDSGHYTDVMSIEIHQAIEKIIKAIYAFNNEKILKTHNLVRLANKCNLPDFCNVDYDILEEVSDYYSEVRYPGPKYQLPDMNEIEKNLNFAQGLYNEVVSFISKSSSNK